MKYSILIAYILGVFLAEAYIVEVTNYERASYAAFHLVVFFVFLKFRVRLKKEK